MGRAKSTYENAQAKKKFYKNALNFTSCALRSCVKYFKFFLQIRTVVLPANVAAGHSRGLA